MPGISFTKVLATSQQVLNSITLVDATGLNFSLGANARAIVAFWLPFTVGATGGFRFRMTTSQVPSVYVLGWQAIDGITATANVESAVIFAAADIANPWAVAGSFIFSGNLYIKNGATAATVKLQFAQNAGDATAITLIEGATLQATIV